MLKVRVLTSLVLIPGFLAALFLLPDFYWSLLMLGVISIGIWEWATISKFAGYWRWIYLIATILAGILFIVAKGEQAVNWQALSMFWTILIAALFWIFIVPVWLIFRYQIKNLVFLAFVGWLILVPTWFALICLKISSLLALVNLEAADPWLLLVLMLAVWIADSAAYFFGKRFGKRKLAPFISPGKTWEGVLGAWLAVSLYGLALCLILHIDLWLIIGLWGITVISIMGDLLESLIKRQGQVKDSGDLLPGHGGLLDRIDGLTSALPLAAFFIYFPLYYAMLWHD